MGAACSRRLRLRHVATAGRTENAEERRGDDSITLRTSSSSSESRWSPPCSPMGMPSSPFLGSVLAARLSANQDKEVPSLLTLCIEKLCQNLHAYHSLSHLPVELCQRVLSHLIANHALTLTALDLFKEAVLEDIDLSSAASAVCDDWVPSVASHSSTLRHVSASGCRQLSDAGLLLLLKSDDKPNELLTLSLDGCDRISDTGFALIKECSLLTHLSCKGMQRVSADGMHQALAGVSALQHLDLEASNHLQGCFGCLGGLSSLTYLSLGWCLSLSNADVSLSLPSLTRLSHLSIARTRVTDAGVSSLSGLIALRSLSLAGCHINGACLVSLKDMQCLTSLSLQWCAQINDNALSSLSSLALHLLELNLGYTSVGDSGLHPLRAFSSLRDLNLDSTSAGDDSLRSIAACSSLTSLNLSDTAVGNDGLRYITVLPSLQSLNLSTTAVTDEGLVYVARITPLLSLDADSRHVTDAGLRQLSTLTRLTELGLFGSKISDTGAEHLRKFPGLRSLEICGGGLTDIGMKHVRSLTRLTSLNVAQNSKISDAGLRNLTDMVLLECLNVSGCDVTAIGLAYIRHLASLSSLGVGGCRISRGNILRIRGDNHCRWRPFLSVSGIM